MITDLATIMRTVEATIEGLVTYRESVAYGWAVGSDCGLQYATVKGEPPANSEARK
jgi:hypothetical protein